MDRYDAVCARLDELRQQMDRGRKLDAMVADLEEQRQDLLNWEEELGRAWNKEEADVDRLEKGLGGFLASLMGGKEEKLEKEKAEAYAARVRYDAKVRERQDVEERIEALRRERMSLSRVQREYDELLAEKKRLLRQRSGSLGEEIGALDDQLGQVRSQLKEVDEALNAGEQVRFAAQSALGSLDSARSYGTWDMLGGGFVATALKHERMQGAQNEIERIQWLLSRFSAELRDVQMTVDVDLPTEGLLSFADYFFDGFFVDLAVQDRISRVQDSVYACARRVDQVMDRLEERRRALESREQRLTEQLAHLVDGAV